MHFLSAQGFAGTLEFLTLQWEPVSKNWCEVWLGLLSILRTVSKPLLSSPEVLYDSQRKMLTTAGLAGLEQTMGRQSH